MPRAVILIEELNKNDEETLLKKALQEFGFERALEYRYNEHGKPYINGPYFSISHSEGMLTCAVSDIEIGIDIEKIGETKFDVAKRFFSPDEYESLLNGESFYDIWTKKESYIKMLGLGMTLKLNSFDVNRVEAFFTKISIDGFSLHLCSKEEINDKKIKLL